LIIKALSLDDMELVRQWRDLVPETLRTPYPLTVEQQKQYYNDVICNRNGNTRYYGFWESPFNELLSYGGIENIQWASRIGELSVIVNPNMRGQGWGRVVVSQILNIAFNVLNLQTVYAESYKSGAFQFWEKIAKEYNAYHTILPNRKYWDGKYWDSIYISFSNGCEVKE